MPSTVSTTPCLARKLQPLFPFPTTVPPSRYCHFHRHVQQSKEPTGGPWRTAAALHDALSQRFQRQQQQQQQQQQRRFQCKQSAPAAPMNCTHPPRPHSFPKPYACLLLRGFLCMQDSGTGTAVLQLRDHALNSLNVSVKSCTTGFVGVACSVCLTGYYRWETGSSEGVC
jgi:hypothetical protein